MLALRLAAPGFYAILSSCTPLEGNNPLDGRELGVELLDKRGYSNLSHDEQHMRNERIKRLNEENPPNGLRIKGEAGVEALNRF